MRRAGTIWFTLLWLLTLIGGPLSGIGRAFPKTPEPAARCEMPPTGAASCCCKADAAQPQAASVTLAPASDDCSCALTEAPLPPSDTSPRLPVDFPVAAPAPPACSAPPVPTLRRVRSPHVGTLAPPLQSRPRAPDIGRAPPHAF